MTNKITIARPYAKAIFAVALQDKTMPAWSALLKMAEMILQDKRVIVFLLQNPKVSLEEQYQWLEDICKPVLFADGQNLFKLLASRRRLELLPAIAQLFTAYCIEHEKTLAVHVKSASALTPAQQQQLVDALKQRLQRNITLECQIDETILGGTVIKANDLVIDDSVRSKLQRLAAALVD